MGCAQRACRVSLNLLHDEAPRQGNGPLDLPVDYRSPWWTAVGDQVRAAGCSVLVYGSPLAEPPSVIDVAYWPRPDEPSRLLHGRYRTLSRPNR